MTWSWDIEGLSLHSYTVGKCPPSFKATGFGENDYATILKTTLEMDGPGQHAHRRSWTSTIPRRPSRWWSTNGACGSRIRPERPGFLEQQNCQRDAILALNLNIFARHCRPRAHGQHRADGERAAGDDPHEIREDGPHSDLPGVQDVPAVPGRDLPPGAVVPPNTHGDIALPRVDAVAMRDTAGKLWVSLVNLDPHRAVTIDARYLGHESHAVRSGLMLAAPRIDSVNTFEAPGTVAPKPFSAKAGRS